MINPSNGTPNTLPANSIKFPFDTGFSNWKPGDGDGQRNNEFVSLQKKELFALATYPLLGAIAAKLVTAG